MFKRKGSWILLLPFLSSVVSAGIVTNQYARRDRLRGELKSTRLELERAAKLLPAKYRAQVAESPDHSDHKHDHKHDH